MLLPLPSQWPRESLDVVDLRLDSILYGSATEEPTLVSSKPDSLSPTKIISDSTFSLLSRTYSSSSTESSCECSETSSVDENFLCGSGSGSPRIGPTMEINSTNWVCASDHPSSPEENVTAAADGDDPVFSLIPVRSDAKMIIPLTGVVVDEQKQQQLQEEQLSNDRVEATVVSAADLETECTGRQQEDDDGREWTESNVTQSQDGILRKSTQELSTSTSAKTLYQYADVASDTFVPASTLDNSLDAENTSAPQDDCMNTNVPDKITSVTTATTKPRKSSLRSSGGHTCSTCHLHAPSELQNFYLHAWLNQQSDIYPTQKRKKKVSWPGSNAELKKVILVERWIEKGVHVHPHPTSRNGDDEDSDSEEEDYERKRVEACEKEEGRVAVRMKGTNNRSGTTPLVIQHSQVESRDSDSDSVGSAASVRWESTTIHPKQENRRPSTPVNKARLESVLQQLGNYQVSSTSPSPRTSPTSSLSSASSTSSRSSSSSSTSSTNHTTEQPTFKPAICTTYTDRRSRNGSQSTGSLPPKKKYSSGIKVTIIGGSASEHEAAIKIRGADPIKHRALIENYWQF